MNTSRKFTPVFVLLGVSRPAAIAGLVVAVVVDPIERQSGGAFTHVSKKVSEVIPALANGNTATAPETKFLAVRIVATGEHVDPRSVGAAPALADRLSRRVTVLEVNAADDFAQKTTARSSVAASQICCGGGAGFSAAITFAAPEDARRISATGVMLLFSVGDSKNSQTPETLICDIHKLGHSDLLRRIAVSSGGWARQGPAVALL